MRVMVVSRLFSGLADGLADGVWRPTGVPAIAKLLEALAADGETDLLTVFAAKDESETRFRQGRRLDLPPLGATVILPWARRPWLAWLGLDGKLREVGHLLRCLWLWLRFRPDVAYFTNAAFPVAAVFARLRLCRVILRLLGLHPEQRRIAEKGKGLQHYLYRSPFDHVICSLDGSGAPHFLPKLISDEVPRSILLNGVDRGGVDRGDVDREAAGRRDGDAPMILYIGRLEWNKGCREFVAAMLELRQRGDRKLRAVLVGDGALRDELAQRIAAASAGDDITLVGAVPHGEVARWLAAADIFVSLNRFGNLSNANLEAIAAGKCMVILRPDPAQHVDAETDELIPADTVVRIGRDDVPGNLARALDDLRRQPDRVRRLADRTAALAGRILDSWENRIVREITIIRGT